MPETALQRSAVSTPATLSPASWSLREVCLAQAVAAQYRLFRLTFCCSQSDFSYMQVCAYPCVRADTPIGCLTSAACMLSGRFECLPWTLRNVSVS